MVWEKKYKEGEEQKYEDEAINIIVVVKEKVRNILVAVAGWVWERGERLPKKT